MVHYFCTYKFQLGIASCMITCINENVSTELRSDLFGHQREDVNFYYHQCYQKYGMLQCLEKKYDRNTTI
jgi:hypothetical protein